MTAVGESTRAAAGRSATGPAVSSTRAVGAIASLGAGAIHATAAGTHGEHRAAAIAFVLLAIAQVGWGALALARPGVGVGALGVAVNTFAIGGWLQARTGGIAFIAGLDTRENVGFPDAAAAFLAVVAIVGALTGRRAVGSRTRPAVVALAAVTATALAIPAMVATTSHAHSDQGIDHDHEAPEVPEPYTATLPVDLGGVPGVSDEEVAQAEALVTETLQTLPRFSDIPTIVAAGYRSIGDADTGFEHFINWELLDDGRVLDPGYPESLVFSVDPATGEEQLNAAMFMANPGDTLDTVPALGGALVQWHIHNDLCWQGQPNAWRVADVVEPSLDCRPGTFRLRQSSLPMVHVWIVPHPCGPFAALDGDGAGQIRPGEARLCDHAHGAPR